MKKGDIKKYDEFLNESFRRTSSGQSIRNYLAFQSTNQREFSPGGNFEASLIDVTLIGDPSMPLVERHNVETGEVDKAYEDIKNFAVNRLKQLQEYRPK